MFCGKSIIAVIPARGGSKGVPAKNIRDVAGKPLLAWTIEQAKHSQVIDRTILSSDDQEIISVAQQWGCETPFVRPAELAQDTSSHIEPILHALNVMPKQYDYVVMLQVTSPLRLSKDIDSCVELCIRQRAPACVSVTIPDKSPYWMYTINEQGCINNLIGNGSVPLPMVRQQLPEVYVLNGAVYVAYVKWLLGTTSFLTPQTIPYIMPKERSLDIDNEMDINFASFLLKDGQYGE